MNPKPEKARGGADKLLESLSEVDVDEETAKDAGWKLGALCSKGTAIESIDMLLAATAEKIGAKFFLTRNIKHYERIETIKPLLITPEKFVKIKK